MARRQGPVAHGGFRHGEVDDRVAGGEQGLGVIGGGDAGRRPTGPLGDVRARVRVPRAEAPTRQPATVGGDDFGHDQTTHGAGAARHADP